MEEVEIEKGVDLQDKEIYRHKLHIAEETWETFAKTAKVTAASLMVFLLVLGLVFTNLF